MITLEAPISERALLGAALANPAVFIAARPHVSLGDFAAERHREAWSAMCDLHDAGQTPDVPTVAAILVGRPGGANAWRNGLDVFDLASAPAAGDWAWHLRQMRQAARARAVKAEAVTLHQALAEMSDTDGLLEQAVASSIALAVAADEADDGSLRDLSTWTEFVAQTPASDRWIAPDLLRKGDTVLVLSPPGAGKSTLSRQVCLSLAAGAHPFRPGVRFEPVRTLLVDLENSPDELRDETEPMLARVAQWSGWDPDRAMVWRHPQGLDLRTRAGARLLEQAIVQAKPQVVAMGSLYNAYRRGADSWDHAAEDVQAVLKTLRARYGLALWLEHHSTRGQGAQHTGAPFGGTSWERWPTHGRWLSRADEAGRVYRLAPTFRGDRGPRDLPLGLLRGPAEDPWFEAIWDETELAHWGAK